jgi:protein TonB
VSGAFFTYTGAQRGGLFGFVALAHISLLGMVNLARAPASAPPIEASVIMVDILPKVSGASAPGVPAPGSQASGPEPAAPPAPKPAAPSPTPELVAALPLPELVVEPLLPEPVAEPPMPEPVVESQLPEPVSFPPLLPVKKLPPPVPKRARPVQPKKTVLAAKAPEPLPATIAKMDSSAPASDAPVSATPAVSTSAGSGPGNVSGNAANGDAAPGSGESPARFDAAYLSNPKPPYPALSRRMREEGKVVLRVLVTSEGKAGRLDVEASSGSARLDESALDTVRYWKFIPARRGNTAVQSQVLVPIIFRLDR